MFRLHYWDWRDPEQRDILFKRDRLGENVNGNVVGDLFNNWDTYCWQDISGKQPPIATCDPTQPTNETLRRCPSKTLCDKSNKNWPSYLDVDTAISIKSYDTSPYDRFIQNTEKSYRNYMEGFITQRGTDCGGDTLCTTDGNVTVKRRIHNTVNIAPFLTLARACAAKGYCSRSVCRFVGPSVGRSVGLSVCVSVSVPTFSLEPWLL